MAARDQAAERRARDEEATGHRMLFRATLAAARQVLGRSGLQKADRDDIAQNAAIAAYLGRVRYSPERGALGPWLRGIVRNEARQFLRQQRRRLPLAAGDVPAEMPSATPTPEQNVFLIHLAEHVFHFLPKRERRVWIRHTIEGYTFNEIADLEGAPSSTVHGWYASAVAKIQGADERERKSGLVSIPAGLAAACGVATGASSTRYELADKAWHRAVEEGGQGPSSGLRRSLPANEVPGEGGDGGRGSSTYGTALARATGPLAGLALGILLGIAAGAWWDPFHRARVEARPDIVATAERSVALPVHGEAPISAPSASASAPHATPSGSTAPPASEAERFLRDHASEALDSDDSVVAAATSRERAATFPHGQHAQETEMVAISALIRDGNRAEAEAAIERFARRYPASKRVVAKLRKDLAAP